MITERPVGGRAASEDAGPRPDRLDGGDERRCDGCAPCPEPESGLGGRVHDRRAFRVVGGGAALQAVFRWRVAFEHVYGAMVPSRPLGSAG